MLITGANRGIGLECTRLFSADASWRIYASCREPQRALQLQSLARGCAADLRILALDITDSLSMQAAVGRLRDEAGRLDLLINNAGIFPKGTHQSQRLGALGAEALTQVIATNAVAPLLLTQACRELLQGGEEACVVMVSSGMGSLARAGGNAYGYRMSKAAMNMAMRVLAHDPAMDGVHSFAVHPGWVRTDMGGAAADISARESAQGLQALITNRKARDSGKFFRYDGMELEW